MRRSVVSTRGVGLGIASLVVAVTAWSSCTSLSCGAGTKQVQQKDGTLRCLPVDAPAAAIPCNADLGAVIIGGECVSRITCGPNTTLNPATGQCEGSGGPTRGTPPPCPTPTAGNICINGIIKHLLDNSNLAVGETRRVALFEPLQFLTSSAPPPLVDADNKPMVADTDDGFVFANVKTPASNLIAIAVFDPTVDVSAIVSAHKTGVGGQVFAGQSYRIDAFTTNVDLVTSWTSQSGGIDYAGGAYVMRFFAEPVARPTDYAQTNTMTVPGVQIVRGMTVPAEARYFSTSLATIDTALTASSTAGAAILPTLGLVSNYTGMGGMFDNMPIKWNTLPGGTTNKTVFVSKLNRCLNDACTFQEQ